MRDQAVPKEPAKNNACNARFSVIDAAVRNGTAPTKAWPDAPWLERNGCQCESCVNGRSEPRPTCRMPTAGAPTARARKEQSPNSPTADSAGLSEKRLPLKEKAT